MYHQTCKYIIVYICLKIFSFFQVSIYSFTANFYKQIVIDDFNLYLNNSIILNHTLSSIWNKHTDKFQFDTHVCSKLLYVKVKQANTNKDLVKTNKRIGTTVAQWHVLVARVTKIINRTRETSLHYYHFNITLYCW